MKYLNDAINLLAIVGLLYAIITNSMLVGIPCVVWCAYKLIKFADYYEKYQNK